MKIAGIGVVSTHGRGVVRFEEILQRGWVAPTQKEVAFLPNGTLPVYCVEQETIEDNEIFSKTHRRLDKFCRMAVLAAYDAMHDSKVVLEGDKNTSLGIIVATSFGPHATMFRFLDDILDYGGSSVSPILFSHSVHNVAASYISSTLKSHGPTTTMTQFYFSFQQALMLAQAWLKEGRCKYVLVGSIDECGNTMEYIYSQKLNIADDGKIKPFQFSRTPESVPGEGSLFFLVTEEETPKKYCNISATSINEENIQDSKPDMYIFDTDGIAADETIYKNMATPGTMIAGYAPLFGSMMTGSSFSCATAAIMLKNKKCYASPIQDNPHKVNICTSTKTLDLKEIQCIRYDYNHKKAIIILKR